ncbi:MAG: YjbQ family protein [Planctomycetes bacterium]|nr:YjbQ family protein [Planctomycetota bacterium]
MAVITRELHLSSQGNAEASDITPGVEEALGESGLESGTVTIFIPGATGGITTVEFEPGLEQDLKDLWERLAPREVVYNHDRAWGDGNGHSHLRATLLGPSLTVPFSKGRLILGTWQQIIFIDFDVRPRQRSIILQFMGE